MSTAQKAVRATKKPIIGAGELPPESLNHFHEPGRPEKPETGGSRWFRVVVRGAVYLTAALICELLLQAWTRYISDEAA